MKYLTTTLVAFFIFLNLTIAQEIALNSNKLATQNNTTSDYNTLDNGIVEPSFTGGNTALTQYLQEQMEYPKLAKRKGVEGTVVVAYYITKSGAIENIQVAKSVGSGLDEEAIRLVENMPDWNPAKQYNKPQRVKYLLSVTFELN